jgi:type IV pilus assembly protein PilW
MRSIAGLTLVELLVGMTLALVGTAAMTALLRSGVAAWTRAGANAEAAAEVADGVDQLVRDVRIAGYDPTGAAHAGLTVVAADRIEVTADLDGNGAIDAASEECVGYRIATSSRSLQRIVGAQSLPIVSEVSAGALTLAYYDAAGTRLDPAVAATAAATRVVTVELTATPRGRTARATAGVRLVNR